MMLELVLLDIYKLNKFSQPIPANLTFFLFTCPDVWKHASSLNQISFTNAGFCSIWSLIKLQNVFSLVVGYPDGFSFLFFFFFFFFVVVFVLFCLLLVLLLLLLLLF